ncbi:hypothetical protein GGR52DRAFT_22495 [Hypoxylon sp. FL1284]|nr:hypothetical protein GGR52DRAFT_22495 [Hypoxylon sp. FL1284]
MKSLLMMMAVTAGSHLGRAQATITKDRRAPTTTEPAAAATHTVQVGLQHDFEPDTTKANPGDTIRFNFYPTNHSVVRAAFKNPCIPWELTNDPAESFFSGPVVQPTLQSPVPTWDLMVNNTDPVFFYCSAPASCIQWGMVGVINPNDTFTLAIQKEYQTNATFQLSPGEAFPDEDSSSETNTNSESKSRSISGGAIAGIVIGAFVAVVIVVALIYLCGRKGGIEKGYQRSTAAGSLPPPPTVDGGYNDDALKSPYMNSPYAMSAYSSPSPPAWSPYMGSPHTSYMRPQQSPGFPHYGMGSPSTPIHEQQQYFEAPDTQKPPPPPPAELPSN